MARNRAVFFDRDGTLVEAIMREGFSKPTAPFNLDELHFCEGALHVLNALRNRGFKVLMVTNQPDVAHGYLSERDWERVHRWIIYKLQFRPDEVFMCRHITADNCGFKKPSPLMIRYAACVHDLDLQKSHIVGDTRNDVVAGHEAGLRSTILIKRPYNADVQSSDFVVLSLFEVLKLPIF